MATTPIAHVAGSSQPAGTKQPLHVLAVDTNGTPIGSGTSSVTEYTEGDTDTSITGPAFLWEDASDTLRAVSAAKPLPVGGGVAHDGVDAGNPLKIGGKAASAAPTAVSAADRADALFDLWGRLFVRHGAQAPAASTWTQVHVPASAAVATKSQASAGSGKRNVCTGFTFTLCANGTAPVPTTPVTVVIRDGATGAGTIIWQSNINMPAVAGGIASINRSGLWLVGTAATAMTAEFSAAGPTNTYESVSMDGVIVEE